MNWAINKLLIPVLFCVVATWSADRNYFFEGNAFYDQGKLQEAVVSYRAAIREQQYEPFAWFNLGNSLVRLQKNHLAMVAYRRSAELAPQFERPWILLGDLYFVHGDIGLAISAYNRAVALGAASEHVNFALAECYRKAGDATEAERQFELVLKENPDRIEAWMGLADIAERLGDHGEALRILDTALVRSPLAGAQVQYYRAHLALQMDSLQKAILAMEDGLVLDPSNLAARRHLANLYMDQSSPWMAIFTLEQGLSSAQTNLARRDLHVELGRIYFVQVRLEEALTHFLSAWKLGAPQGRVGIENVSNSYYNAGDTLRATQVYDALLTARSPK